jgi:hypothetical protein
MHHEFVNCFFSNRKEYSLFSSFLKGYSVISEKIPFLNIDLQEIVLKHHSFLMTVLKSYLSLDNGNANLGSKISFTNALFHFVIVYHHCLLETTKQQSFYEGPILPKDAHIEEFHQIITPIVLSSISNFTGGSLRFFHVQHFHHFSESTPRNTIPRFYVIEFLFSHYFTSSSLSNPDLSCSGAAQHFSTVLLWNMLPILASPNCNSDDQTENQLLRSSLIEFLEENLLYYYQEDLWKGQYLGKCLFMSILGDLISISASKQQFCCCEINFHESEQNEDEIASEETRTNEDNYRIKQILFIWFQSLTMNQRKEILNSVLPLDPVLNTDSEISVQSDQYQRQIILSLFLINSLIEQSSDAESSVSFESVFELLLFLYFQSLKVKPGENLIPAMILKSMTLIFEKLLTHNAFNFELIVLSITEKLIHSMETFFLSRKLQTLEIKAVQPLLLKFLSFRISFFFRGIKLNGKHRSTKQNMDNREYQYINFNTLIKDILKLTNQSPHSPRLEFLASFFLSPAQTYGSEKKETQLVMKGDLYQILLLSFWYDSRINHSVDQKNDFELDSDSLRNYFTNFLVKNDNSHNHNLFSATEIISDETSLEIDKENNLVSLISFCLSSFFQLSNPPKGNYIKILLLDS